MSFGPLNDGHPGKHRLEAKVIGSGKAWIATNGRTIVGTWKKTSVTGPTRFYDKNGKQVTLTDRARRSSRSCRSGSTVTISRARRAAVARRRRRRPLGHRPGTEPLVTPTSA